MSTKEIRKKAGCSQTSAAALAGVSVGTWRSFEVAPESVTPESRERCEAALTILSERRVGRDHRVHALRQPVTP
jgi:hypothetical protein